jgi:hypothetical protein
MTRHGMSEDQEAALQQAVMAEYYRLNPDVRHIDMTLTNEWWFVFDSLTRGGKDALRDLWIAQPALENPWVLDLVYSIVFNQHYIRPENRRPTPTPTGPPDEPYEVSAGGGDEFGVGTVIEKDIPTKKEIVRDVRTDEERLWRNAIFAMYGRPANRHEVALIRLFVGGAAKIEDMAFYTSPDIDAGDVLLRAKDFIDNRGFITDKTDAKAQLEEMINRWDLPREFIDFFDDPTSPFSHAAYRNAARAPGRVDPEASFFEPGLPSLQRNLSRAMTYEEWLADNLPKEGSRQWLGLQDLYVGLAERLAGRAEEDAAGLLAGLYAPSPARRAMAALGLPANAAVVFERISGESYTDYRLRVMSFLINAVQLIRPVDIAGEILGVDIPDDLNAAELFGILDTMGVLAMAEPEEPGGFPVAPDLPGADPAFPGLAAEGPVVPTPFDIVVRDGLEYSTFGFSAQSEQDRAMKLLDDRIAQALRSGDVDLALTLMVDAPAVLGMLEMEFAQYQREQREVRAGIIDLQSEAQAQATLDMANIEELRAQAAAATGPEYVVLQNRVRAAESAQKHGASYQGDVVLQAHEARQLRFSQFVGQRQADVFAALEQRRAPEAPVADIRRPIRRTVFAR